MDRQCQARLRLTSPHRAIGSSLCSSSQLDYQQYEHVQSHYYQSEIIFLAPASGAGHACAYNKSSNMPSTRLRCSRRCITSLAGGFSESKWSKVCAGLARISCHTSPNAPDRNTDLPNRTHASLVEPDACGNAAEARLTRPRNPPRLPGCSCGEHPRYCNGKTIQQLAVP